MNGCHFALFRPVLWYSLVSRVLGKSLDCVVTGKQAVFAALKAEGVANLHLLEAGVQLSDDGEDTVDGSHPTVRPRHLRGLHALICV